MSIPTPRTDETVRTAGYDNASEAFQLARELERDLAAMTKRAEAAENDQHGVVAEASRQVAASDALFRKMCAERDTLRESLRQTLDWAEACYSRVTESRGDFRFNALERARELLKS